MHITKHHIDLAAQAHIIDTAQAEKLFEFLKSQPHAAAKFDFTHLLYYLGGLIALGAMTLFMTLSWEAVGYQGILITALVYAGIGLGLTHLFWRKAHPVPATICATFVIALTPLAIYAGQNVLGLWSSQDYPDTYYRHYLLQEWHRTDLYVELGALIVGGLLAWKYRYPFLLIPLALTLWYIYIDVAAIVIAAPLDYEFRAWLTMYFGLGFAALALWVDLRARQASVDYAFWLYLFGVIAFWGGLNIQESDSELAKFGYFCINLLLLGLGAMLLRRVFAICGLIGVAIYLGELAHGVFEDSWLFPFALSAIGFGVIYLGVLWQRNSTTVTHKARSILPLRLQQLLESRHA